MKKCKVWLLVIMLIYVWGVGSLEAVGGLESKRLTQLSYGTGRQSGPPVIDGNVIAWSEEVNNFSYPCYFRINEGVKDKINTPTNNGEPVKVSDGVLVYRTYGSNKLTVTNLSNKIQFGINPGDSVIISDLSASSFYEIKSNVIVFLVGGINKTFYSVKNNNLPPEEPCEIPAKNLKLTKHNGDYLILWQYNNQLLYCNLDFLNQYSRHIILNSLLDAWPSNISAYGNQVIFYGKDGSLYIQEISINSQPIKLPIQPGFGQPAYLIDEQIYYVDNENNIWLFEINEPINKHNPLFVIKPNQPVLSIASNGSDIVWRDDNRKAYWYAGLTKLEIEGASNVIDKGQEFQLQSMATYSNKLTEDVSQLATWESSDEKIIKVENGRCQALSPGSAIIRVEYEGIESSVSIQVRKITGLEIIPKDIELKHGEEQQFTVNLVYSDESRVDVTSQATWSSELNEFTDSLYKAHNVGSDTIIVSYEGWVESLIILVNELDFDKPDEPDEPGPGPEPDPQPEPGPNPEPEPEPAPRPRPSQHGYSTIDENIPVLKPVSQFNKIELGEGWHFDMLRFYSRLILPYPLGWVIVE